ncbi:MAG: hypothetical protein R3181_03465 [Rubricoccaceae bacterium]|nr:hypothetical protein [Rubricoccaceae bacterium]
MRSAFLLLAVAFALAGCDAAVESGPPAPSTVRYLMWGPSNAAILGNQGDEALNDTYAGTGRSADVRSTATWGGRWLMPQGDDGTSCGDFSPRSEDECYDRAVTRSREEIAGAGLSYVVGGVVWHNGIDQNGIDSLYSQEDYDAEFRALIRAAARDLPGVPFYVIEAGTNFTVELDDPPMTEHFRAREAAVCAAEPNCRVISAMTEEVVDEALTTCGTEPTCVHTHYFEKGEVHWQPRSVEIIMEEAGRTLARIER